MMMTNSASGGIKAMGVYERELQNYLFSKRRLNLGGMNVSRKGVSLVMCVKLQPE